jgi:hypothetical protein
VLIASAFSLRVTPTAVGKAASKPPSLHAKPLTCGEPQIAQPSPSTCSTPSAKMRLPALSLVSFVLPLVIASDVNPYDCQNPRADDEEACAQAIEEVVAVTPGSFYTAKIRCHDCPYLEYSGEGADRERKIVHGDNDLVRLRRPFPI